jgi:regulator of sirC expression with transglutaminase-like and TPR domain
VELFGSGVNFVEIQGTGFALDFFVNSCFTPNQKDFMSASVAAESTVLLTDKRKSALITLLADDDPAIYHRMRDEILSHGSVVSEWLRPYTLNSDPILRRRSLEIVKHLARKEADDRFLSFCLKQGEDLNVEEGAWLLAQTQYPDTNVEAYQALLDGHAGELRERINFGDAPDRLLAIINEYVFDDLGFVGNEQSYYDPENSYLNRVMDRRTGNPINLCLVYLLLARRLHLPLIGVGLPGHFICRFQSAAREVYIDVFNRGKLLTKADCVNYMLQSNYGVREALLAPVTSRRMLVRICGNLHQIYRHLELPAETARLQRYLIALSR